MIYFKKITTIMFFALSAIGLVLAVFDNVSAEPKSGIYVNTFEDELNVDEDCSLREAIEAANEDVAIDNCAAGSSGSTDDIYLEAGTYILSEAGIDGIYQDENNNKEGDLDFNTSMNIHGVDMDSTMIDGGNIDRVIDLLVSGIHISITNVTIQNGRTITETGGGGGILIHPGVTLNLSNCRITDNITDKLGGGLDNWSGYVEITNCTIQNNSAAQGGGVYNDGDIIIKKSLINENSAEVLGGGLNNSLSGGKATLENVTVSRNTSISDNAGSGIFSNAIITLTNATVVHNVGAGAGFASLGTGYMKNTIIANHGEVDNCAGDEADIISVGHNLEDGDSCHLDPAGKQDQINTDPHLVGDEPQDNGGLTYTYALEISSPAIDAGSNSGCPATDQRGFGRPKDGDGDGNAVCDIGAFEANTLIVLYFPLIFK
jgi:CSLREA domain-containing protein